MPLLRHAGVLVEPVPGAAAHPDRAVRSGHGLERRFPADLAAVGLPRAGLRGTDEIGLLLLGGLEILLRLAPPGRGGLLGPLPVRWGFVAHPMLSGTEMTEPSGCGHLMTAAAGPTTARATTAATAAEAPRIPAAPWLSARQRTILRPLPG